jgi:exonuclease VII small subunit
MDSFNYFNYFTEIEEYFWRKRGAHLLVSPLDWAIVETWQRAGIPLEAVLRGIDSAFESYARSRRGAGRPLKSLAYCVDAVLDAATAEKEVSAGTGPQPKRGEKQAEPFSREELRSFLQRNIEKLEQAEVPLNSSGADLARRIAQARASLSDLMPLLDSPARLDIENLERRLSAAEEKLTAALLADTAEDVLVEIQSELDRQLAPYRRRMSAEQLSQLERQYTQKRLLERFGLPRLSLFYLN